MLFPKQPSRCTIRATTKAFYTTTEAAEALGVSSARVRQMILAGDMAAEKVGRDLLIPLEAVERARQRQTKPGPEPQTEQFTADEAWEAADEEPPVKPKDIRKYRLG